MAFIHRRRGWRLAGLTETPESEFNRWMTMDRRSVLKAFCGGGAAALLAGIDPGIAGASPIQDKKKKEAGSQVFPAPRNDSFKIDGKLTDELAAARYNNFYEFSTGKRVSSLVKDWDIGDWKLEIGGLVDKPVTFGMDDLANTFKFEERLYRFRCVETWAMTVPWTGFPLKQLIDHVKPQAGAKFVRFISFDHKKAKGTRRTVGTGEPWPYTEGLTLAEASNDLTMVVTGIYGHSLPKQHGAPVRMVIPWKYGFKGAKSLVRIEFVSTRPATFWPTIIAAEYDFVANVDPTVPHPRWSQASEWDVGTRARRPTLPYNGYGDLVASLYSRG